MQKKLIALAIALAPLPVAATDYTGLATLIIGFPAVFAALVSNAVVALSESPGKTSRSINGFFNLLFLLSLIFVVGDVLGMLESNGKLAAVIYLFFAVSTVALALKNFGDSSTIKQSGAR